MIWPTSLSFANCTLKQIINDVTWRNCDRWKRALSHSKRLHDEQLHHNLLSHSWYQRFVPMDTASNTCLWKLHCISPKECPNSCSKPFLITGQVRPHHRHDQLLLVDRFVRQVYSNNWGGNEFLDTQTDTCFRIRDHVGPIKDCRMELCFSEKYS